RRSPRATATKSAPAGGWPSPRCWRPGRPTWPSSPPPRNAGTPLAEAARHRTVRLGPAGGGMSPAPFSPKIACQRPAPTKGRKANASFRTARGAGAASNLRGARRKPGILVKSGCDSRGIGEGRPRSQQGHTQRITMYYPMRMIRTRTHKLILNLAHPLEYPTAEDLFNSPTWQGVLKRGDKMLGERSLESYLHRPHE